jgi:hypothetical protein
VQRDVSWPAAWPHSVFAQRDLRHGRPSFIAIVCAIAVIAAALPEAITKVGHHPFSD